MPAVIKRRKVTSTNTKNATTFTKPRGLDAFTRVSKASTAEKVIVEKNTSVDAITVIQKSIIGSKRRLLDHEEEDAKVHATNTISTRSIKPLPLSRLNAVPKPATKEIFKSPSTQPSSTDARSLLDQLIVSTKDTAQPEINLKPQTASTIAALPNELLDLINLHAAFLTALSLHYAHNGTHSPADLRLLCPDVARAWGKRRVVVNDIRRTLGVLNANISDDTDSQKCSKFSLSDYGSGKICIEIQTEKTGRLARPVNENMLNDIYVHGLRTNWEDRAEGTTVAEYIKGLPMEVVTTCESLSKMSPLLAKGQRRLEDMKNGFIIKKETIQQKKVPAIENASGAKPTLLERLRAKQIHQSTLPAPASKEQLSRKAALQRIDEVAGVLAMLSTSSSIGQQRVSFTMPTVLGKLRDSFKTPMSKEEGDVCVRLLAAEIAPEWVRIVKMGKMEAMVVNRDGRPSELDIKERVGRAVCVL